MFLRSANRDAQTVGTVCWILKHSGRLRYCSLYSTLLRGERSGDRIPVGGATFPVTVQTGPEAQPASCAISTGVFRENGRGWSGRGVVPTHMLIWLRSGMGWSYTLCLGKHVTFSPTHNTVKILKSSPWRQGELWHRVVITNSCLKDSSLLGYSTTSLAFNTA